ncbi:Crp/Fnr family transcriptional regulator [Phormidium sp. CCY1219]|uniref:Crp/Fnr family transcriptional regulator n=1 Tax=Phormidium sp. CCY1219 TaxID=2886104 RepID=UPI002D1F9341|nr:Crp/Fnr family transcriptional regulator [Phormidium sp. CCY1219]MEB3828644.1 Crp/Fnr family transcriptional regulator [Phormidium sp. CCY1219]
MMTIASLASVSALPARRTFSRKDLIPLWKDVLWKIERGIVRSMTWSEEGSAIATGYWGPGDVVGQPVSCIKGYQLECLSDVEVSMISAQQWPQSLDAIRTHAQQTEQLLSIIHSKQVDRRLLQFLFWLGGKFGRPVEGGQLVEVPLTHQEIGEAIAISRVTVTRLLQRFEREGVLHRPRRSAFILYDRFTLQPPA